LEGGETSCLFSVVGGFFDFKRGGKGVGVGELVNWWIWKLVGCEFGGVGIDKVLKHNYIRETVPPRPG